MRRSYGWLALLALAACSRSGDDERAPAPTLSVGVASRIAPAATVTASAATDRLTPRVPPASKPSACTALCERSRELKCPAAATCESRCAQMQGMPSCGQELAEALACFGQQPLKHWECDDSGVAAVRDGYCVEQQARVARCVQGMLGGNPK